MPPFVPFGHVLVHGWGGDLLRGLVLDLDLALRVLRSAHI